MTSKKLPANFSPAKHLNDVIRREQNQRVKEWFRDIDWQDGEEDIDTPRNSLRVACTIRPEDTSILILERLYLFYDVLGFGKSDLAKIYGNADSYQARVSNNPQLFLYFSQDADAVPAGANRIGHEKSCRLSKYSYKTGDDLPAITKTNLLDIAREIKQLFLAGSKGITYTCGKLAVSYTDPSRGFSKGNYWLVNSKSEAISLYEKLCNAVDQPFDIKKVKVNTPEKDSTSQIISQSDTILGKSYKRRAYRPIANLRFRYAYVTLGNVAPPIFLVDTTNRQTAMI